MQNALNQMAVVCQRFLSWCVEIFSSLASNDILLIILGLVLFVYLLREIFYLFGLISINLPFLRKKKNLDNYSQRGGK